MTDFFGLSALGVQRGWFKEGDTTRHKQGASQCPLTPSLKKLKIKIFFIMKKLF
ncbi:hypothetical protein QP531_05075 [Peptoniphilus harei]|nr:hypothetical protein [Peptoniphilus harei]MDU6030796.1 hypothetical protein [Peptoniphilus harei]